MAALTADKDTLIKESRTYSYPVAASTRLFAGSLVCVNASGNAVPASDTLALAFAGIAKEQYDNRTGAAGDLRALLHREGVVKIAYTSTAPTVGADVFAVDDQTVALTATTTNDVRVGKVVAVESGFVWVDIAR